MITFAPYPIPVVTEDGKDGYVVYVESSSMLENDVWTVCLLDGGIIRHFTTKQLRVFKNATFEIKQNEQSKG